MLAGVPMAYWIGFHVVVLVLIGCDIAVLNRGTRPARTRTNLIFVLFLIALAAGFGAWLAHVRGQQTGLEFASGYLIELSLSIDNLFVFLVMFRSFGLGVAEQRKALVFGILGAIVMRGLFILGGVALLHRFGWVQFVFGALLLIAAVRLAREKMQPTDAEDAHEETAGRGGKRQWTRSLAMRWRGKPKRVLLSAIIAVEVADVLFALDSIPAVLAVTHDAFVVYTSNIAAILGLRSLYFLLAGMLERLRFLHFGLAAILAFVGCKMILSRWVEVPVAVSLGVIVAVIAVATATSLLYPAPERRPVGSK
jgi:TerC family integral membrane protein